MTGDLPEYAVLRFESGYLKIMRYTILLSISRDKATLLTDKQTGRKRHNPNKPCGLARRGWLAPPLSVVLTVTITHNKGVFRPKIHF